MTGRLFARPRWAEARFVAQALRAETVGGGLLLLAAVAAIGWANSPLWTAYRDLGATAFGPASLGLRMGLGQWASDGLLALFFFVAGLELKRELLVGDLRRPDQAAVPVAAALSGVVVPALAYLAVVGLSGDHAALHGWAVPTATDIAFALAALALLGTHLPSALRSFLLTLAVVDDLVAIVIIATVYTRDLHLVLLAAAAVPVAIFGWLVRRRVIRAWLLVPLAVLAWALVHASGVHATVAGVALAATVPVRASTLGPRFEHLLRPWSAGLAVPVFAFFAAGVRVVGGGLSAAAADPAALGVVVALVVGKVVGVFGGTWAVARFTRARLDDDLAWWDVLGLSLLAGIGFTVSLLVGQLAFGPASARDAHIRLAVLVGSITSTVLAGIVLRRRNRVYRRLAEAEADETE